MAYFPLLKLKDCEFSEGAKELAASYLEANARKRMYRITAALVLGGSNALLPAMSAVANVRPMQRRNFCITLLLVLSLSAAMITQMRAQVAAPAPTPVDEFTIVALPDTQFYSSLNPQIFAAQTQWIANHVQD